MRRKGISIKWKIFLYLLGFTACLLIVLWLIQVCYLDVLYKNIKMQEAKRIVSESQEILKKGGEGARKQIDELAARNNVAIFVADTEGKAIYSAEYIPNSSIAAMPAEQIRLYYRMALENGGSTKIEFKGTINGTFWKGDNLPKTRQGRDGTEAGGAAEREESSGESATREKRGAPAGWISDRDLPGIAAFEEPPAAGEAFSPAVTQLGEQRKPEELADVQGDTEESGGPAGWISDKEEEGLRRFVQNWGQDWIESVIFVNLAEVSGRECVLMVNTQLTPVDATVNTLRVELAWITFIMVSLSLVITLLLSCQISKSLTRISEPAKEMARGNYAVRFEGKGFREVEELSETLNVAAAELEKNDRLRRELIANVSHDLRTPLTMIVAYAEAMRDLPGEDCPENIQVIIDEAGRLSNLVSDLLDISKLEAGVMEKNVTRYNLTESIQSVLQRYNKLKEQDGYVISFSYDRAVMVEADEYKVFQVIYNLINNAVNYTGPDKKVWVRQRVEGEKVRIEVEDDGEGIAPEALPYVWDRYYKVDKTHKRAVMGSGLGLSIVKNVLEMHGAEYGVESEVGKGSVFWFELELAGDA